MSRGRCISLDRAQRAQHQNILSNGSYIPGRSPNRSPKHVLSTPEMVRQNCDGDIASRSLREYDVREHEQMDRSCILQYDDNNFEDPAERRSEEFQQNFYPGRTPQIEDLPDELLEAFEEPSFYDIPANASFDEVMCAMATPPAAAKPVVEIDKVRDRIAAHIGTTVPEEERAADIVIDDVRKRIAAMIEPEPELCPYKIPPLPKDPREIPPHPKDPKDVVGLIRRARAIERLKAIEEAEAAATAPKKIDKKGVRRKIAVSKRLPLKKTVPSDPQLRKEKPSARKAILTRKAGAVPRETQRCPQPNEHPPDYVPPEWAAAILRARKLAGVKTKNSKLLPKPKTPPPRPETALAALPSTPTPPTYENVMLRAAAVKARIDAAHAAAIAKQTPKIKSLTPKTVTPITEDELDEFEALEQLYDVVPTQRPTTDVIDTQMQERMAVLQRQLFQSPGKHSPRAISPPRSESPQFEIPPVVRYYVLLKRRETMAPTEAQTDLGTASTHSASPVPEYEVDLEQFQGIADWGLADLSGPHPVEIPDIPEASQVPSAEICPATPSRSSKLPVVSPRAQYPTRSQYTDAADSTYQTRFDDALLQNIEMPDFDVDEVPDYAFSVEAMSDAGFFIEDDLSLGEISMPDFEEDISIDEYHLEDITSPDLYDLSISGSGMALEPHCPLELQEKEADDDPVIDDEASKSPGFLTSMVNALVGGVRNIFTPTKLSKDVDEYDDNLQDTSLPNLFEATPPPPQTETQISEIRKPSEELKQASSEGSIEIPPMPKDPNDYVGIVRRAQAIHKKKAKEAAEAAAAAPPQHPLKEIKKLREIKSTIPKRAPLPKKKVLTARRKTKEQPTKVYPPGEYSPGYVAAVARARTLAGYQNLTALLNPERAARIAERKAAKEAELAAIEALPPVERMRAKMERMKKRKPGDSYPKPSIETLGTLEAIRSSLPMPETQTLRRKWKPAGRLRADRRKTPEERVFTQDFGRILVPSKRTVKAKKGWKRLDVMSPLSEESNIPEEDFMQFSPLKPREAQIKLQYLKEQATRRAAETIRAAEEAQANISPRTPQSRRSRSPRAVDISQDKYSPIRLQSPGSPRTEQTRRETVTTQIGENGGEETIREEVVETSTIENGEVRTSSRHVTTKTDEFGNVTCHIQEGKGMSGEEDAIPENLADVEPPDFFNTSDIPPPIDSSIPTPSEIIDRIRLKVQQKLNSALPTVEASARTQLPPPRMIEFPEDLPDEELFDVDIPEFERTPQKESPQARLLTPIETDERMYAWGEHPPATPPTSKPPTPKAQIPLTQEEVYPPPRSASPLEHPKDPKNYAAIIKRAQAIQKRIQQESEAAASQPASKKTAKKGERVPISRWDAPPLKDSKKPPRRRMVLKKRIPKAAPKKDSEQEQEEYEERVCPAEPPPLPADYVEQVARARLMHGLENKTALLNPKIAAKLAEEKAAQAAYEALPEYEKIKRRMEQFRRIPTQKHQVEASAEILGTIAAIRENMPSIEEICPKTPRTPSATPPGAQRSLRAPLRERRHRSLSPAGTDNVPAVTEHIEEGNRDWQLERSLSEVCLREKTIDDEQEFQPPVTSVRSRISSPKHATSPAPLLSRVCVPFPVQTEAFIDGEKPVSDQERMNFVDITLTNLKNSEAMANLSLDEFEALEREIIKSLPERETMKSFPAGHSLADFEALQSQVSLDEFRALEAEAMAQTEAELFNYQTPKRKERYRGRQLFTPPPPPVKSQSLAKPPAARRPPRLALTDFDDDSDPHRRSIYYNEIQDFIVPSEQLILDTSNLMPETPQSLQERFKRLKDAQTRQWSPTRVAEEHDVASPISAFTPIMLVSPSGTSCVAPVSQTEVSGPVPSTVEDDLLIDIDNERRQRHVTKFRRFQDLEDMPFDELEFEDEPNLENISLDRPTTPPPRPSDIVSRIRAEVEKKMREKEMLHRQQIRSPDMIKFPEDLPEEELFELSAPSLAETPQRTPEVRQRSPRVSLPMAWGEVCPLTPTTPPVRVPSPARMRSISPPKTEIVQVCPTPKDPSPERPIVIPPFPKDPKDYRAIVKIAQAIHKINKQKEIEAALAAPPPEIPKAKGRVPISRWQGPPPKKSTAKPRKKLVMKKRAQPPTKEKEIPQHEEEDRVCPAEPPPFPDNYVEHVARARLLHGLKNRTALLNPKIAARIAAKKAAEEAAAAAFAALPEHEKIKARLESLRKKPRRHRGTKPTTEQIAYLEALKLTGAYDYKTPQRAPSPKRIMVRSTQRAPPISEVPLSPRPYLSQRSFMESPELAEFEALEQMEGQPIMCPTAPQDNAGLAQRMAYLEQQLLESEEPPIMADVSLAEFEALEEAVAPPDLYPAQPVSALKMSQIIAELQEQQLATPPRIDPREKFRQIMAQMQATPHSPEEANDIFETPEIYYSPIRLSGSESRRDEITRAEKSTTQITRSGNNTIKEQVVETSEIVDGELQHITTHVTTTTDPNGNVQCQINESKRVSARDTKADLDDQDDLGGITQPSLLDITPVTPSERPRPRDIIERVGRELREGVGKYRPEVPTGQLFDLRTPPRMLSLPEEVPDENILDFSYPSLAATPPRSPVCSPIRTPRPRSSERTPNISLPEMFVSTPPAPVSPTPPPLPPVSPLRQRAPSPEGPIVIPPFPKDPNDYAAIVRIGRKIRQLRAQEAAERQATEEAAAAAEAAKPKKRVPLSRWTAPPPKKPGTRKKLVMRKRGEPAPGKCPLAGEEESRECPAEPPPLPKDYLEQVALARRLAGLKNRTAALNPKVAAREAAKAEAAKIAHETEVARLAALNAPPPPPIEDFGDLLSRMTSMREKGAVPRGQPSLAAAAYIDALKEAMDVRQQLVETQTEVPKLESPKTRFQRIMTERVAEPPPTYEVSPARTPTHEDISYTPIRFESPPSHDVSIGLADNVEDVEFNIADFEGLEELGELGEWGEPSYMDVSDATLDENQYMPQTPPETPTRIIRRIANQVRQQQAVLSPPRTPAVIEFPENLPDEELFELSAPSFARSPPRQQTPIKSPNISIPQFFQETPPPTPKSFTPRHASPQRSRSPPAAAADVPPQRLEICPIRELPEETAKAPLQKVKKAREPISRRPPNEPVKTRVVPPHKKGRLFRKLVLKKKAPPTAVQPAATSSVRESPIEPPELPPDYVEAVAKARRLAGLKNKADLAFSQATDRDETRPLPDFASVMERAAALRTVETSGIHQVPTSRQLTAKQNFINRQQRQERKRMLRELERMRQQADANISLEFEPTKTPLSARQRLEIIKSKMPTETPPASQIPYSPAKTPDLVDLPHYQPIEMPTTPPYQFLENVRIPDIEDVSIPFEVLDDYDIVEDPIEAGIQEEFNMAERIEMLQNQLLESPRIRSFSQRDFSADQEEFDKAEAEADAIEQLLMDDRIERSEQDSFEMREAEAAAQEFNMCKRIETLQNQLFESPRQKLISRSARANAASIKQREFEMAEAQATAQRYDMANRMRELEKQYLQSPEQRSTSPRGDKISKQATDVEYGRFLDQETQCSRATSQLQEPYDNSMDEFEAMEREFQ